MNIEDLLKDTKKYIVDPRANPLFEMTEEIKNEFKHDRKFERSRWFGLLKGISDAEFQVLKKKALGLPPNYNKAGFLVNQLKSKHNQ